MIDLVAIVPFYVELVMAAAGQDTSIGFMRIIRCERVTTGFLVLYEKDRLCSTTVIQVCL